MHNALGSPTRRRLLAASAALGLSTLPGLGIALPECRRSFVSGSWEVDVNDAEATARKQLLLVHGSTGLDFLIIFRPADGLSWFSLGYRLSSGSHADSARAALHRQLLSEYFPALPPDKWYEIKLAVASGDTVVPFYEDLSYSRFGYPLSSDSAKKFSDLIKQNKLGFHATVYRLPDIPSCEPFVESYSPCPKGYVVGSAWLIRPGAMDFDTVSLLNAVVQAKIYQSQLVADEAANRCANNCYLTGACCSVLGLEDDCWELRTLRRFRNIVLHTLPGGSSDIAAYYRDAPAIAATLLSSVAGRKRLLQMYWRYMLPSALMAYLGLARPAHKHYKAMVNSLLD